MRVQHLPGGGARTSPSIRPPLPSLADYEQWFATAALEAPALNKRFTAIGPALIRRIVIMRREGYSFADIGQSLGHTGGGAWRAYNALPEALR